MFNRVQFVADRT